jgi:hypothetical protein
MSPWDVWVTIAVHMGKTLLYAKFAEVMVMYIPFGGGTFSFIGSLC